MSGTAGNSSARQHAHRAPSPEKHLQQAATFSSGSATAFNVATSETFVLTGTNTWSGATTIDNNAAVNIGNKNASGTLSTSTTGIFLNGSNAFLDYDRNDSSTWGQVITTTTPGGGIRVRGGGMLDLDGTTNPSTTLGTLNVGNGTFTMSGLENLNISGLTSVGDNLNSGLTATSGTVAGILNVPTGTTLTSNTMDVGTTASLATTGTVNQTGGTVVLTAATNPVNDAGLRLGVSAAGTGTYNLSAGSFTVNGTAQLDEAIDGTGNFVQSGGTASAFELDVNALSFGSAVDLTNSNPGLNPNNVGGNEDLPAMEPSRSAAAFSSSVAGV